ncbi:hypothetical protein BSKO_01900 [Bryopsis sp. KO-2023]|nr:hypothetical protein BSKO_01900 [Bryopsis sp. KO-2023]
MDEANQSTIPASPASIENTGETSIDERDPQGAPEGVSQPLPPSSDGGGDREAKPVSSAQKTGHHQSYSDICTPRTVVIHDVSDSEESSEENEQEIEGNHSVDMEAELVKNEEEEVQEGEEFVGQGSSGGEGLPVSMHLPFKNSLSSGSLGTSGELRSARGVNEIDGSSGEIDVSGNVAEHTIGQQAATECMTPVPEAPESNGDTIQASDLVVLAEEVNRLERELEASQAHVAKLQKQQQKGGKGGTSKEKSAVPKKAGESSKGRDAGEKKKKGGRSLEIIHSLLQGEIDDGDIGHLRSRLLRAENSIEIERQKASKLKTKFALDSQMVANGEKAVNDMAKVKSELNRVQSENEKLSRDLEQERERVELLRAQLSKLVAAGESQVEDHQRMQHGLEASTKDAREAREQFMELTVQHQALHVEARDLRARTEISEKVAMEARRELEVFQKSADSLTKENSELSTMVQKQASQIQQMRATPPSDQATGPVPESRPAGRASHEAQHHSPNFPDPPSTEVVAESSKAPPAVEHDLDLVILAQEVDRLEKELAKERNAKLQLLEELQGAEKGSVLIAHQSDGGTVEAREASRINKDAKQSAIPEGKVPQPIEPVTVGEEPVVDKQPLEPVIVGEEPLADNGNVSPSVTSQLTVLQPPQAQSQSKGWGFGLWGFIAGSDLVDE